MREHFENHFIDTDPYQVIKSLQPDPLCFKERCNEYKYTVVQAGWDAWQAQQTKIDGLKDSIEMALISLNHLKENTVTHRDHGNEHTAIRDFNDLLKLASDVEDCLLLGGLYGSK